MQEFPPGNRNDPGADLHCDGIPVPLRPAMDQERAAYLAALLYADIEQVAREVVGKAPGHAAGYPLF